eukprot:9014-Heterococcus_DN1.PRE.5
MVNDMEPEQSSRAVQRQDVACKWIQLCVNKRRQVLVVADRISMLEDLSDRVKEGTQIETAFLMGKTKAKDRELAKDANVILASYACASEGLDVATLDSIVLLTPRSGSNCIVQCVGRLLRSGGRSPLVIDFVDQLYPFQNMFRKRCMEYRRMGAELSKWSEQFTQVGNGHSNQKPAAEEEYQFEEKEEV